MSPVFLANFPIAFVIFAAVVGIPMWLIFKHPDKAPTYSHTTAGCQPASGSV